MSKFGDEEYYTARAVRERRLAETAPAWMMPKHTATAEHYERLAENARRPAAPDYNRKL